MNRENKREVDSIMRRMGSYQMPGRDECKGRRNILRRGRALHGLPVRNGIVVGSVATRLSPNGPEANVGALECAAAGLFWLVVIAVCFVAIAAWICLIGWQEGRR